MKKTTAVVLALLLTLCALLPLASCGRTVGEGAGRITTAGADSAPAVHAQKDGLVAVFFRLHSDDPLGREHVGIGMQKTHVMKALRNCKSKWVKLPIRLRLVNTSTWL